ncbi:MAG: hypothetical protein IPK83_24055 [Planctomycetes bacterium]|nr:hypothetical protein [Planctomycetota bacterium]
MLACQCVSTLAVVRRETGRLAMAGVWCLVIWTLLAYCALAGNKGGASLDGYDFK